MKQLMILMLLMFATITATAQTADDEFNAEVRKSIELQHMGETLENTMKLQMTSAFPANHISTENMDAFIKEISVVMKPKLEVILRKVYVDNFTLEDMKQMNAFMATPVGQKTIKLAPMLANAGAEVAKDPEVMKAIQDAVMKYMR